MERLELSKGYKLNDICSVLHCLVQFVQFKKREKHPWRSDLLVKLLALSLKVKVTLLHGFHLY